MTFAVAGGRGVRSPNPQKLFLLVHNRPGTSAGGFPPDYAAEIRHEFCQTTKACVLGLSFGNFPG
jgi:hypothetical protein